jgi:uncharacterized protein YndB with AHSA1/START domain
MFTFTASASIDVARPPEAVFAQLLDPASWPRWVEDMKRVDAPSPMKAGDSFDELTTFRGEERWCRGEVVQVDAPRRLVLRITSVRSGPELLPTRRFDLVATGPGTRVTWTNDVEARGALVRVLKPILPSFYRKKMEAYLRGLKDLAERS